MNMTTADMTNSPYKTIWNLSWPQILMMIFHLMIGLVDVWVASKLGREIQASMGMISQSLFLFSGHSSSNSKRLSSSNQPVHRGRHDIES